MIHPSAGVDTYFPAVAVDSAGNVGMTYMESSSSEYVSMYITGRLASDPVNTMSARHAREGRGGHAVAQSGGRLRGDLARPFLLRDVLGGQRIRQERRLVGHLAGPVHDQLAERRPAADGGHAGRAPRPTR